MAMVLQYGKDILDMEAVPASQWGQGLTPPSCCAVDLLRAASMIETNQLKGELLLGLQIRPLW